MRRFVLSLAVTLVLSPAIVAQTTSAPKKAVVRKKAAPAEPKPIVHEQAVSILQQAATLVAQVPVPSEEGDDSRVELVSALAAAQWRAGDRAGAKKSYDEAVAQAKALKLSEHDMEGGSRAVQQIAIKRAKLTDHAGLQPLLTELSDFQGKYTITARKSEVLRALAEAQADAGMFKEAAATAAQITDEWQASQAWIDIMQAHIRRGDMVEARAALEKVAPKQKDYAQSMMVWDLADAGRLAEAIAIAATIPVEENSFTGPSNSKTSAFRHIAEVQAKNGDIAGALKTIENIPDSNDKFEATSAVMLAQRKAGDTAGVERSYQECIRMWEKFSEKDAEGNYPNSDLMFSIGSWRAITEMYARAGKWDDARKNAEEGVKTNNLVSSSAVNGLVFAYLELNDYANAVTAARMLTKRDYLVQRIATEQTENGDEIAALTWAGAEATPELKAYALIGVAEGLLNRAEKERKKAAASGK